MRYGRVGFWLKTIAPVTFLDDLFNLQLAHNREWGFHNARVNTVAWSPDSAMVASGSLDTTIIIWSVANPAKHTIIKSKSPRLYQFELANRPTIFLSLFRRRASAESNNPNRLAR